jgi:hypothetical protein
VPSVTHNGGPIWRCLHRLMSVGVSSPFLSLRAIFSLASSTSPSIFFWMNASLAARTGRE